MDKITFKDDFNPKSELKRHNPHNWLNADATKIIS